MGVFMGEVPLKSKKSLKWRVGIQGCLAHKKLPPP